MTAPREMAADVMEGANASVMLAQQNKRAAGDGDRQGVAGIGNLTFETREHPQREHQMPALQVEPFRVGIGQVGQAATVGDIRLKPGKRGLTQELANALVSTGCIGVHGLFVCFGIVKRIPRNFISHNDEI